VHKSFIVLDLIESGTGLSRPSGRSYRFSMFILTPTRLPRREALDMCDSYDHGVTENGCIYSGCSRPSAVIPIWIYLRLDIRGF
jgi:hypothetical protein